MVAAWLIFLPSQFLGRQTPRKQAFCCVSFFGERQELASAHPGGCLIGRNCDPNGPPCLPMGAEWDAIAIRMSPCAFRWVRKRIQIRSERFPMHPMCAECWS